MEWRVFPPPKTKSYREGDLVFVRSKSAKEKGLRGVVVSVDSVDPSRVVVRFTTTDKKKWTKSISMKRLLPVYDSCKQSLVIVTSETPNYRHLAASQLDCESDHVLEIGCSTGQASVVLVRYAHSWIGYDTSSEMIQQCNATLSSSQEQHSQQQDDNAFTSQRYAAIKMDPFSDPTSAKEHATKWNKGGPNVIFVDIGGNRELTGIIQMVSWSIQSFSPRLVVVKSRALVQEIAVTRGLLEDSGRVRDADKWFASRMRDLESANRQQRPQHPLQAPLSVSPLDGKTPICRYHNYHSSGCKKKEECPLDHEHCHRCRRAGHIARNCPGDATSKDAQTS